MIEEWGNNMLETDEILDIVDSNNHVIGKDNREETHKKGLLHRAVMVFIINSKGQIFLQQRSGQKANHPLAWDVSCAEHVQMGESFKDAALRGIEEELGITVSLERIRLIHRQDNKYLSSGGYIFDNELGETFKGFYDGEITLDPSEVSNGKFVSLKEIKEMVDQGGVLFTPWFMDELEYQKGVDFAGLK